MRSPGIAFEEKLSGEEETWREALKSCCRESGESYKPEPGGNYGKSEGPQC